jgi:cell wall-associated NlpC family hydrolase
LTDEVSLFNKEGVNQRLTGDLLFYSNYNTAVISSVGIAVAEKSFAQANTPTLLLSLTYLVILREA